MVQITKDSIFIATLLKDDPRTGIKAGRVFYPKGVYWNHKDVILVGEKPPKASRDTTTRLAFPEDIVSVEVMECSQNHCSTMPR